MRTKSLPSALDAPRIVTAAVLGEGPPAFVLEHELGPLVAGELASARDRVGFRWCSESARRVPSVWTAQRPDRGSAATCGLRAILSSVHGEDCYRVMPAVGRAGRAPITRLSLDGDNLLRLHI